jgi:hypothetical protein
LTASSNRQSIHALNADLREQAEPTGVGASFVERFSMDPPQHPAVTNAAAIRAAA